MLSYLAGLATIPAVLALIWASEKVYNFFGKKLRARGWSWELNNGRTTEAIPDWRLKEEIFWEEQRGPIFTGHWYRSDLYWNRDLETTSRRTLVTRWFGVGNSEGRCLMIFRKKTVSGNED